MEHDESGQDMQDALDDDGEPPGVREVPNSTEVGTGLEGWRGLD